MNSLTSRLEFSNLTITLLQLVHSWLILLSISSSNPAESTESLNLPVYPSVCLPITIFSSLSVSLFLTIRLCRPLNLVAPIVCISCPYRVCICSLWWSTNTAATMGNVSFAFVFIANSNASMFYLSCTWTACEMGGKWLNNCCLVECCF